MTTATKESPADNASSETKPDINPANSLGRQERELMMLITGPQPRLPYPTKRLKMSNGCVVEKYIIPDADKAEVLDALYPSTNRPGLDDTLIDLHTGKEFKVRDYIVTREGDGNFLVTPYYAEAGGTVLDWIFPTDKEEANPDSGIAINAQPLKDTFAKRP